MRLREKLVSTNASAKGEARGKKLDSTPPPIVPSPYTRATRQQKVCRQIMLSKWFIIQS